MCSTPNNRYTVYFAGSLFNLKELKGNLALSESIERLSGGKYLCVLPQKLEQRSLSAHEIRDQDIKTVLRCDLLLANYDGTELDSGTVIEYMIAKFAGIPACIVRTDFRLAGDQVEGDPWNLMSSYFPVSANVVVDGMDVYKKLGIDKATDFTAKMIVESFDSLLDLDGYLFDNVDQVYNLYSWVNKMVGFKNSLSPDELSNIIKIKIKKGLIQIR